MPHKISTAAPTKQYPINARNQMSVGSLYEDKQGRLYIRPDHFSQGNHGDTVMFFDPSGVGGYRHPTLTVGDNQVRWPLRRCDEGTSVTLTP